MRERRQQFKEQKAQAEAANELLEVTVPPLRGADRPEVHAIEEMDEIPLALARRFVDTAFKPLDDWEDWDVIEQFQTAAVRYQIDHMIYTIALQKFTRTPAFRGYQDEAMRRLVEKYQQRRVWSYWAYENLWGNLEWDPDPARKQNIMLTGFFALSLGAFQTVTGDSATRSSGRSSSLERQAPLPVLATTRSAPRSPRTTSSRRGASSSASRTGSSRPATCAAPPASASTTACTAPTTGT